MPRAATKTASILSDLYDQTFEKVYYDMFRITWPDLRSIAGVAKITTKKLEEINQALNRTGHSIFPSDNFLIVAQESDLAHIRLVPAQIVEKYIYDEAEAEEDELEVDEDDDEDDIEQFGNIEI